MKSGALNALKDQKILVTGATGFIGTHVAAKCAEQGSMVYALADTSTPQNWKKNYPEFKKLSAVKFFNCSLLDLESLKAFLSEAQPSKVIHLAASVNLERSFDIAQKNVQTNILGTLNLLEALKTVLVDRFVFLSTVEVYGENKIPFEERQRELPPSPYAISKLAAEHFCRYYSRLHQIPVTILRVSTCYGPGQGEKRIVPSVILSCLKKNSVRVSHPDQERDFVYVEDVAEGIVKSLVSHQAVNEVINLGSERSVSIREIVSTVKKITQSDSQVFYGTVPQREMEMKRWSSSSVKARKILGWRAKTSLNDGLKKTIRWYRARLEHGQN